MDQTMLRFSSRFRKQNIWITAVHTIARSSTPVRISIVDMCSYYFSLKPISDLYTNFMSSL